MRLVNNATRRDFDQVRFRCDYARLILFGFDNTDDIPEIIGLVMPNKRQLPN